MLKVLPVGLQSFQSIRDNDYNYLYVDKTEKLLQLALLKQKIVIFFLVLVDLENH